MNREIKFRGYTKKGQKMLDLQKMTAFAVDASMNMNGLFIPFDDDVILMQWTGLRDKNGTEVFEGDIVKCSRGCPHEIELRMEYAGTFGGGMPAYYLSGLNEGYAWTQDEEVIGNIYSNPELLQP